MSFARRLTVSIPAWVWEKYFQSYNENRSAFFVEIFLKGISVELNNSSNLELRLIEFIKKNRELEAQNINLKHTLELVKGRLMTQEKRREEKRVKEEGIKERKALERLADGILANNPLRDMER